MVLLMPSPPSSSLSPRTSSPRNLLAKPTKPVTKDHNAHRRALLLLASSSLVNLALPTIEGLVPASRIARALEIYELEEDERRAVRIFQVRLTVLFFYFSIVFFRLGLWGGANKIVPLLRLAVNSENLL
jgi:hypothetical protein